MTLLASDSPSASSRSRLRRVLDLWFGVDQPVSRRAYATSGFALMAFKYSVEAAVIVAFTGHFLRPWDFLNPLISVRQELLAPGPAWLPWALFVWTLPFLWIAVTMSVRRAADAGGSPWTGLLVLIPIVNLAVMLFLCIVASQGNDPWMRARRQPIIIDLGGRPPNEEQIPEPHRQPTRDDRSQSWATAIGIGLLVGALMLLVSVYLFASYGASLFLGTPILMGATASYIHNRRYPRGYAASMGIGLATVFFACLALLLFALEGAICIAMAAPLLLPIGAMGGLIGKAIADATRRPPSELLATILILPLLAGGGTFFVRSREQLVLTTVDIRAPAATVWNRVVDFPELTEPKRWFFSWGIACPERARIVGRGTGATRYCDFTTGTFVEPITTWDEPRRLAFDVAGQPEPMVELSPYRDVHPPHLNHYLRSTHGEFRLIALPDGGTRLEGRTWYKFDMFPQAYWTLWSDTLIHQIHRRVLEHIKALAEMDVR